MRGVVSPISSMNTVPRFAISKHACPIAIRTGEAAAHVTEQLGLEQRLGQRRTVDRDQLGATTRAALVNQPGDDFFARTALAGDQYFRVAARRVVDLLLKSLDRGTRPDELGDFHRLCSSKFGERVTLYR